MPVISLVDLDKQRIAIELHREGQLVVLTGVGVSASDPSLGKVLRVELDEEYGEGDPVFIIPEADIMKVIRRETRHGCKFCMRID